jgi:hypothetical protein
VWVPHLSERIHSIGAKTKSIISSMLRKVLMAKDEKFPLPTISMISDLSIPLPLDLSKQERIPSIREHTLQTVNDR